MASAKTGFDLSQPIPLLLLGDGPDQKTGLGRLGHDIAWLLSGMPEFKVGYLGRATMGRASHPWAQYSFSVADQWGEMKIEEAWKDLSQGRYGIILTLWDASRLTWFADPVGLPGNLEKFLTSGQFERWGYFMQDGAGANPEQLPLECAEVFARYNRVLLASQWAYRLTQHTIQLPDVDWIPHGINTRGFKLMEESETTRQIIRGMWGVEPNESVIGCVMSNTQRKHWATVFEAIAKMPEHPKLWIHTDRNVAYWNLNALAIEYGLMNRVFCEAREMTDIELAWRYRACDATVVISGGEGFCYPIAESMICGTPVVTGDYSAGAELAAYRVRPMASFIDTSHNVRRAVYHPVNVGGELSQAVSTKRDPEYWNAYVKHLDWNYLGSVWKKWIRKGL